MKRYFVALIGILAIMSLVAVGCGGDDDGDTDTGTTETTKTQEADTGDNTATDEKAKELFVTSCGSCHVLSAAGTKGAVGPSLDEKKPSKSKIEKQIKDGSKGMPAGLLSGEDATEVTDYVVKVEGK